MKHIWRCLWMLLTVACVACGGDDPTEDPQPQPVPAGIQIPTTENTQPVVRTSGGSMTLMFSATGEWTATSDPESAAWLSFSPTSGGAGTHTLLMSLTANDTYDARVGTITLTCGNDRKTILVTQMQKDALIVALNEYRFAKEGGTLDFEVQTNLDLKVTSSVDWLSETETRALRTEKLHFTVTPNEEEEVRMGYITLQAGDLTQNITVTQEGSREGASSEREILMALFQATDGEHWIHRDNWGSNLPLSQWYGVKTTADGHLWALELNDNGLKGYIPNDICGLTRLGYLYLGRNQLTGNIPEQIGEMRALRAIWMVDNHLSGALPTSLGDLPDLYYLALENNQLSGSIPAELGQLSNLQYLYLEENQLEGEIPAALGNLSKLVDLWLFDNQLTGGIPESLMNLKLLKRLYIHGNLMDGTVSEAMYSSDWWSRVDLNIAQQEGHRLHFENLYVSSDFSADGRVECVQRHTLGKGIPLVITGDGFSDRLIEDGTFKQAYNRAVAAFFSKEPYTTYRQYFDVYVVTAVSVNEMIDEDIAFETHHNGTFYDQNSDKVAEYVAKVPELGGKLEDVTSMVVLHERSGGRVHSDWYSDGFTIGLCTLSDEMEYEVCHEVGGHGFGKLADEYWDDDEQGTTFPMSGWDWIDQYHAMGWYYNVDYRSDPEQVLWKDFISDGHYKAEGIGVYEGGMSLYSYGIYRPTETSLMRGNTKQYNAPSRWSIYQKIMEQAGETYTFQNFLAYDQKNLPTTRMQEEERTIPAAYRGGPVRIHNRRIMIK